MGRRVVCIVYYYNYQILLTLHVFERVSSMDLTIVRELIKRLNLHPQQVQASYPGCANVSHRFHFFSRRFSEHAGSTIEPYADK